MILGIHSFYHGPGGRSHSCSRLTVSLASTTVMNSGNTMQYAVHHMYCQKSWTCQQAANDTQRKQVQSEQGTPNHSLRQQYESTAQQSDSTVEHACSGARMRFKREVVLTAKPLAWQLEEADWPPVQTTAASG